MASSSSLSIRSVSHRNLLLHEYNHRNQNARPPSSLMMPNRTESASGKGRIISMGTSDKITYFNKLQTRDQGIGAKISGENLDQWMRESVVDIVKNLRQAPLVVQVYEENEKDGAATRLETEKAVKEKWAVVKGRWERGETPLPQGVIFVEELGERIKDEGVGDSGAGEGGGVWTAVLFVEDEQGEGIGIDVLHTFLFGEGEGVQGNDRVTAQELLVGATSVLVYQLMNFHGCRIHTHTYL